MSGTTHQVWVYDFNSSAGGLVNQSYTAAREPSGQANSLDLSPDGRFVAFRSSGTNVVPGAADGVPQVYLHDRQAGSTVLLSANPVSHLPAGNWCFAPRFSADGRTVTLQSWAANLVDGDFNNNCDLFTYAFLCAAIRPGDLPNEGPWLSWPATPGGNYRVQFKYSLDDPDWHELGGSVSIDQNKAWLQDTTLFGSHRFYRIVTD